MTEQSVKEARPALSAPGKTEFWDAKILGWEASRYSLLSRCNPFSWTVRRRMSAARRLVREDFKRHQYVLDLGCGSGLLAQAVLDAPVRRYKGIDFSTVAVEAALARFPGLSGRVRFGRMDVLDGPGWEAPLIVFLGLLDWLDEKEAALLFGKLKAENLIFSFTDADSGLAGRLYRQYRRCADKAYTARNFPKSRIADLAGSNGYRVDSMTRFSYLDPGRLVTASKK